MPDWLTHILLAWALWNFISLKYNLRYRAVFIVGSLLPDIKTISMITPDQSFESALNVFHTPAGALVTSGILSLVFFRDSIRQRHIFAALGSGSIFHLLLDTLVSSMEGRVMLFFPLSFESYSFNIFMQEDFTFLYIALAILLVSFIALWLRGTEQSRSTYIP